MNSRMDKYYKESALEESRVQKNKKLYGKINEKEIESLDLTNNISVIDTDSNNLDIEKLKQILEQRYDKKSNYTDAIESETNVEENLEDTKEYDLNKILEAAHKSKKKDYSVDRFRKLHDVQYDILNSLNLDRRDDELDEEIIHTSSLYEEKELQEDNLMSDLITDDESDQIGEMEEEMDETLMPDKKPTLLEELEKTKQISKLELQNAINKKYDDLDELEEIIIEDKEEETDPADIYLEDEDAEEEENEETEVTEDTEEFYTGKLQIKDRDLDDDFEDIRKEMKSGGFFIKLLIFIIVVIIIGAGVYFANEYFNLGLF